MYKFIARKFTRRKPVAQILPLLLILGVHDSRLRIHPSEHPADVAAHGIEILLQNPHIAIMTVELPRDYLHGRSPADSTAAARLPRSRIRHITVRDLSTADVTDPFVIECLGREIVHHGCAGYLTVTGVRTALPVRTVAGNGSVHIVKLALLPYLVYLVDQLIGCAECAGSLHIAAYHMSLNLFLIQGIKSGNLHLGEHEPREACMIRFIS